MARFGKMAALSAHKSTRGVPCIVSWAENACSGSDNNGGSGRYYIEVQRYQGDVSEEDAKAGMADSNPYIVNKRMSYFMGGKSYSKMDHQTSLYAGAMHAIESISQSDVITTKHSMKSLFAQATAETSSASASDISDGVAVHHYFVKLNVGFGNNEAFIYIPKANVLNDPKGRNMPLPAGKLTQEMLDKHNHITRLAKEAAQELYGTNYQSEATNKREIPNSSDDVFDKSVLEK